MASGGIYRRLVLGCIGWAVVLAAAGAEPSSLAAALPAPPALRSPADTFRELLQAGPAEREQKLAGKPAASQAVIIRALREYEALPVAERELRLQTLELGWHLDQLFRLPANQRAPRLAQAPVSLRGQIQDRLVLWDQLAPDMQQQVLGSRSALRVLLATNAPASAPPPLPTVPAVNTASADRQRLQNSLRALFELDAGEQARILRDFSQAQQTEMQRAMRLFQTLPQPQRDQCLDGLTKFTSLSPEQRQDFLRNCDVWKSLTPAERETWRQLMLGRPQTPPMPPGRLPPGGHPPAPQVRLTNR